MKRSIPYALLSISFSLFILAGCVHFATPKTVPETLAFNYATVESLSNSTAASLRAGSITAQKAKSIRDILEQGYRINKMAETAWAAGETTDADSYLTMASQILTQLEGML